MIDEKTPTSRGRPRKFDSDLALETAMILFNKKGYDAVSVSELCNEIGIASTSIYAAYGNKAGVFKQTVDAYVAGPASFVGTVLAEAKTVEGAIEAVFRAAALAYTFDKKRPGCLVLSCEGKIEHLASLEVVNAKVKETQAMISVRLSELGAADPEVITEFIVTIMRGLSASSRAGSSYADLVEVINLVMQGVRPTMQG